MSAETNTDVQGVLADYRVIDLTDERGHLAGLIWAQMGADVIAIEPPEGSSARRLGPFAGDVDDPERSLHHWSYNRGKRSVVPPKASIVPKHSLPARMSCSSHSTLARLRASAWAVTCSRSSIRH